MDDIDRANAQAEELLRRSIAYAAVPSSLLLSCGKCHNCHATLAEGAKFCDADCRDDWEKRNR